MFSRSILCSWGRGLRRADGLASEVIRSGTANPVALARLISVKVDNDNFQSIKVHKHNWLSVLDDVGKHVGQSTFDGLEWFFKDDFARLAPLLRKLDGSKHPVLGSSKFIVRNWEDSIYVWGLLILLVSKTAGYPSSVLDSDLDENGILPSQRVLADTVSLIRISFFIQKSVYNLQPLVETKKSKASEKFIFGNKISLLGGDYFLSKAWLQLSQLRNQTLIEGMAYAMRDFTESEFIGKRDEQNEAIPSNLLRDTENREMESVIDNPEEEWEKRNNLTLASLMARSCRGAMQLAGHPPAVQDQAYLLGRHFTLARQAYLDAEPFLDDVLPIGEKFSLVSAPVLFHLNHDPNIFSEIEKGLQSLDKVDYNFLHQEIIRGPALEETWRLKEKHVDNALNVLETFPPSKAREALSNLLVAM